MITLANIVVGVAIAYCVRTVLWRTNTHFNINQSVFLSWKKIFLNNVKFLVIYAIPYFGLILYILSFGFIYILIGVSLDTMGLSYTLQKLIHLPLEVFALSLPLLIFTSDKIKVNQRIKIAVISSVSLLLAAIIESNL